MAGRKLTLSTIRRVASALPGMKEGTSYGAPALAREHLVRADPETFFFTGHSRNYPSALARLDRLSAADLRKLLQRAIEASSRL